MSDTNKNIIQLTPERAESLLAINNFPGQRPLMAKRLDELRKKIKDGRFHAGYVAVAHVNGRRYLMNGQHQCTAVKETGVPVECFYQDFQCDNMTDAATVFAQFDDGNVRSGGQVAHAFACASGLEMPKDCAALCAGGCGWAKWHGPSGTTKEDRAGLLLEYSAEVEFVRDLMYNVGVNTKFLRRVPVAGAAIVCASVDRSDAGVFWESVRDGDMLSSRHPAFRLREHLMRLNSFRASKARNTSDFYRLKVSQADSRELFTKCLHAWNAYRTDRTTDLKYYATAPIPVAV